MPNIGEQKQTRRSLFSSVVYSVIFYGASIWANTLSSVISFETTYQQVSRTVAREVAGACRTVFYVALSVIAGMSPVDLIATERNKMYREGRHTGEDDFFQEQSHN